MHYLSRIDRALFACVSILSQFLLWVAVAAGFAQVLSRFVLHTPLEWSEILIRASVIWAVLLGMALAFRSGSMISVEFLHEKLKGCARQVLGNLINTVCLAFLVFLCWIGGRMTYRVRFQSIAGLDMSISWIYLAIPVGAAIAAMAVLARWAMPESPQSRVPVRNDAQG